MLNLCVVHGSDGGDVRVETKNSMYEECLEVFVGGVENDEWEEVDLEKGLFECKKYGNDSGSNMENWDEVVKKYVDEVSEKKGKFYLWGVEYDLDLMFVEEGEKL